MANLSTQLLEDLIREAEVLSPIKADVPNAWNILTHEIGRARAILRSAESTHPSSSEQPSSDPPSTSQLQSPPTSSTAVNSSGLPNSSLSTLTPSISTQPPVPASPTTTASVDPLLTASTILSTSPQSVASSQNPTANAQVAAAAAAAIAAFADVSHPPPPAAPRHPIRKRVKLPVPAEQYPDYNFVGRLLGPRGATLKRLERESGCRIMIRGKGSIRKDKEAEVRGKPGYEHVFNEPLHVVIEVVDATDENSANQILRRAKEFVEMLLIPVPEERDSLKRAQLRDLAILNGTHRSLPDILAQPTATPVPANVQQHPALNIPIARSPPSQMTASPPPLRRSHSSISKPPAPLYSSSDPYTAVFDPVVAPFSRVPPTSSAGPSGASQITSVPMIQRSVAPFGTSSGKFGGNPSASDSFLPDLTKLHIPSLDFDALNEPGLSSPLPMGLSSPTLVDPDMYPYPPTPGVMPMEQNPLNAFASPMWSTTRGSGSNTTLVSLGPVGSGLPPRSPPPLPPRSPPPNSSGATLPDMNNVFGSAGNNAASSFFLGRHVGDNNMMGHGARGREIGRRDFDAGFATPLSSPRITDDELCNLGLGSSTCSDNGLNGMNRALGSSSALSHLNTPAFHFGQMSTSTSIGLSGLASSNLHNGHILHPDHRGGFHEDATNAGQDNFADDNSSIMLSKLFPGSSCLDGGEQVSLRFHQSSRQVQDMGSASGPSTTSN